MSTVTNPGTTQFVQVERPDGSVGRIAYDDQGTGPAVLLAPGMGTTRATFRHLVPVLLRAGYRVITTDYRGLGESDTGWDEYSSAATADDLAALIRHIDAGPVLLYGNSYTAASAVHLAADHPELLRGAVLSGPFVRSLPAPNLVGKITYALMAKPLFTRTLWMVWFPHMFPKRPADYAEMRAAVDANLREPGRAKVFAQMCAGTHDAAEAKLPRAKASGVPMLVIMGTADEDFPNAVDEGRFVAESVNGRLELLDGYGHQPHEETPEQIADLITGFDPAR
ncbi:alpha/beta hydrolase [Actinospica sp. MGRD01-02]|uniref:Alpha/beta hydrolase n=1 Tax=Actinospica acidithermotolerans TaxID=2828514 RepID=A0A941IKW2_9ACTN|nr:alpha/beta hydrolase [Actinospica acidithermotolerans]MBR7829362.1 alpha/beta hydrolase [Actinospica acidithermotolerans]